MDQFDTKLPERQKHYIKNDDCNRFIYLQREWDDTKRTILVMHDVQELISLCNSNGDFDDTSEYQLLIRLLKERTIVDDGGSRRLRKKEEVEESSKVLLNSFEPEAAFRKKQGQNIYSDNQLLGDYLEKPHVYDEMAALVADGAYRGETNVKTTAAHQIKFVVTNFTSKRPADIFAVYLKKKIEAFHELVHFRNGVEAILLLLCRRHHVDKTPAYGKK